MNLNRVFRFSFFQAVVLPIAGISQLIFISYLSRELGISDLKDAFYILNLSTFLIFADFGNVYNAYREASANVHSSKSIKSDLIRRYLRKSLIIAALNFLVSGFFLLHEGTFLLGVYIAFNAGTIPGLVSMHLLRGFGRDFSYLILFHSSWPTALLLLIIISKKENIFDIGGEYLAFLPTIALSLSGFVAIISCLIFQKGTSGENTHIDLYSPRRVGPIVVLITGALAMQIDKLYIIRKYDPPSSASYLFLAILMFSTINSISAVGSTVWGSNLSNSSLRYDFHFKEFLFIGIGASFLYFTGISLLVRFKIIEMTMSYKLVLIMALTILTHTILISLQAFITFKSLDGIRTTGNLLQIFGILVLSLSLHKSMTVNSLALIVLFSVTLNLSYLAIQSIKVNFQN